MAVTIDFEIDTDDYAAQVEGYLDTAVRPALAEGLDAAAELVIAELVKRAAQDFDRPRQFTLDSFDAFPASSRKGSDVVDTLIYIPERAASYLAVHIDGGVRRAGDPGAGPDGTLVPGKDAVLDEYGDFPRGWITRQDARPDVFWTTLGHGDKPALVRRDGEHLEVLALLVDEVVYRKRFDFYGIVEAAANKHVPAEVGKALARRTSRSTDCQSAWNIDPLSASNIFARRNTREIPPNGQGIAALMALGMLQHLGIREHAADSVAALHLQIEAMKLAFADTERYVGDPDFMHPVGASDLLDPGYLASRAGRVDRTRAQDFASGAPTSGGTVCLSAADSNGMMVSFIQSNYSGFGSGIVVPGTGISLQNRGSGFTVEAGHPNQVGPRKRPFHTIIPGFALRAGQPDTAFGLMGGPMQAQGHVQLVLRMETWGQDPQTAADAPRWRVVSGRHVVAEAGVASETLSALRAMGHDIVVEAGDLAFGFGGAQIIRRIDSGYVGGSDPRKDGLVAGY